MIDILDIQRSVAAAALGEHGSDARLLLDDRLRPQKVAHRSQSTPLTSARLFMSSGKMRLPLSSVMVVSNLRIHRA